MLIKSETLQSLRQSAPPSFWARNSVTRADIHSSPNSSLNLPYIVYSGGLGMFAVNEEKTRRAGVNKLESILDSCY